MNVNLDELLSMRDEWKLTMTIEGKTYATREPTDAEIARVESIANDDRKAMHSLIKSWFVGDAPDVKSLGSRRLMAIMGCVLTAHAKRNANLATKIRDHIGKRMEDGER